MKFKKLLIFIFLSCFFSNQILYPAAKYFFSQQVNDMCMIAPMVNLKILENLKEKYGPNFDTNPEAKKNDAFNRRQWFGENHKYLRAWHLAFNKINQSSTPDEYKSLQDYINDICINGPVLPNFYKKNGKTVLQGGITGMLDAASMPFLFVDLTALNKPVFNALSENLSPETGLKLPFVRDSQKELRFQKNNPDKIIQNKNLKYSFENEDRGYMAYSIKDHKYYPVLNATIPYYDDGKTTLTFPGYDKPEYQNLSGLPRSNIMQTYKPKNYELGFSEIAKNYNIASSYYNYETQSSYAPYMLGLYKLMLLTLGINNNNETISEKNTGYKASQILQELVKEDQENNPWSNKYFTKDKFLQYAIADIFKQNPKLYKQTQQVVDFYLLNNWTLFSDFTTGKTVYYKDQKGTPYDLQKASELLPGNEQALAYFVTQNLRMLWYGAASKNAIAFYKSFLDKSRFANFLQMSDKIAELIDKIPVVRYMKYPISLLTKIPKIGPWLSMLALFYKYKTSAYTQKTVTLNEKTKEKKKTSFIQTWQEIKNKLIAMHQRRNWISFDSHGWVVSFDDNLIQKQKAQPNVNINMLRDLGFSGIESWHGSELNSFYKFQE